MQRPLVWAGVVVAAAGLGWSVWQVALVTAVDGGEADGGYGGFVLAVTGLVIAVAAPFAVRVFQPVAVASMDHQADQLGEEVRKQWTRAALERGLLEPAPIRWCRSPLAVAGSAGPAWFPQLPGLAAVTDDRLREGGRHDLHTLYGGLGSGRLLIVGPAGAGKSAAAILLLLDALRFREHAPAEDRAKIPVPVMLALHGWDPSTEPVRDWVVSRIVQTYPFFAGRDGVRRARALLDAGRIAVFLEGVDEMNKRLRPVALRALSNQAYFRLVAMTRSITLATAAKQELLAGAAILDVRPVAGTDASAFLLRSLGGAPPASWQLVANELRSGRDGPLVRALDNPLALTLLRDTYRVADDVAELLDRKRFPTAVTIQDHLLDRLLLIGYAQRRGQPRPRYSLATARRTLRYLARRLSHDRTRDLAWWNPCYWTPWTPRALFTGCITAVPAMFVAGPGCGLLFAVTLWLTRLVMMIVRKRPTVRFELRVWLWLSYRLVRGLESPGIGETTPIDPRTSWRQDLAWWLARAPAVGLGFALVFGLTAGPSVGAGLGLLGGLATALTGPLTWSVALAQAQLAITERTPLRLMHFLEDARSRRILHVVGQVYQFRHAKLEDRLANHAARW